MKAQFYIAILSENAPEPQSALMNNHDLIWDRFVACSDFRTPIYLEKRLHFILKGKDYRGTCTIKVKGQNVISLEQCVHLPLTAAILLLRNVPPAAAPDAGPLPAAEAPAPFPPAPSALSLSAFAAALATPAPPVAVEAAAEDDDVAGVYPATPGKAGGLRVASSGRKPGIRIW